MHRTTVRRVGDEFVVELPPEIVEAFGLKEGDTLHATAIHDGVLLSRGDLEPGFRAYERGAAKYRNALRELDD